MPTTEPTLPIRELPEEIEVALSAHATTCFLRGAYGEVREGSLEETEGNLRNAIRAALDERNTAPRRELTPDDLARYGRIAMGGFWEGYTEGAVVAIKRRWQQAAEAVITAYRDDLRPRGGDET